MEGQAIFRVLEEGEYGIFYDMDIWGRRPWRVYDWQGKEVRDRTDPRQAPVFTFQKPETAQRLADKLTRKWARERKLS